MSDSEAEHFTVSCPECEHGTLRVRNAIYTDCDNCDALVERNEVGI